MLSSETEPQTSHAVNSAFNHNTNRPVIIASRTNQIPRIWGRSGTFDLNFPPFIFLVYNLPKVHGSPVPQLSRKRPKLVTTVAVRGRLTTRKQRITAEIFGKFLQPEVQDQHKDFWWYRISVLICIVFCCITSYHNTIKVKSRVRLGVASHLFTTPKWGNPLSAFPIDTSKLAGLFCTMCQLMLMLNIMQGSCEYQI